MVYVNTSDSDIDWSHCVTGEVLGEPHQLNTVHTSTTNSDIVEQGPRGHIPRAARSIAS